MNAIRTTLIAAIAAVVLIGTGAAAGAVAATPSPGDAPGDAGPPSDLPDQVPDFVGDLLSSVNEFLSGDIDDLGETVSDIAGTGADDGDSSGGDDVDEGRA